MEKPIFTLQPSHWLHSGYYAVSIASLFAFPAFALIGIYKFFEIECWKYEFHEKEIIERKGVFNVSRRKILFNRIKDVAMDEPILHRLVSIGNYTILSSDPYSNILILRGVTSSHELWNLLRGLVSSNNSSKKQLEVDLNYL